jgi:predicted 3-demethylubiquinone-9 3-methyltransferase (glyoxalase superfamily)
MIKQKITPYLWFDDQAEEAANFYVSLFKDSKVLSVSRYPDGTPAVGGKVMVVEFQLEGHKYMALNGGPHFKLTEAFSLFVLCEGQEEVDAYWTKLLAGGGAESQCGWLKDRFGLSWQIVPRQFMELIGDQDEAKAKRVMQAMMQMVKLDVEKLRAAYEGR